MSSRRGSKSGDKDILSVSGGIIGNGVPVIQMGEAEVSVGTPGGNSRSQTPLKVRLPGDGVPKSNSVLEVKVAELEVTTSKMLGVLAELSAQMAEMKKERADDKLVSETRWNEVMGALGVVTRVQADAAALNAREAAARAPPETGSHAGASLAGDGVPGSVISSVSASMAPSPARELSGTTDVSPKGAVDDFFVREYGDDLINAEIAGNPEDGQKDEKQKNSLSLTKPTTSSIVGMNRVGYNNGIPDVSQCAVLIEVISQWSRTHGGKLPFSLVEWLSQDVQSYFQNASLALENGLLSDTRMWIAVLYKHIQDYGGAVLENFQKMTVFFVNSHSTKSCVYKVETAEKEWRTFCASVMRIVRASNNWSHLGDKTDFLDRVMDILLSKLPPILEERVYPTLSTGSGIIPGTTFTTFADKVSAALGELGQRDGDELEKVLERHKELTGATSRPRMNRRRFATSAVHSKPGQSKPGAVVCFNCSKTGHIAKDCRAAPRETSGTWPGKVSLAGKVLAGITTTGTNAAAAGGHLGQKPQTHCFACGQKRHGLGVVCPLQGKVVCYNCQKEGHMKARCPSKVSPKLQLLDAPTA